MPGIEKNLSKGFKIIDVFFCKNVVLNICRYLKRFYTYKKINKNFLKVRPYFIKNAKNHGNRLNHSCRKTRLKNITNTAYKYVRATLKRIIIRFAIVFQFVPRVVHTFQVIHLRINILQAPIIPTTIVLQLLVYGV